MCVGCGKREKRENRSEPVYFFTERTRHSTESQNTSTLAERWPQQGVQKAVLSPKTYEALTGATGSSR